MRGRGRQRGVCPGACGKRYCPTCAPHLADDLRERLAARLERLGPGPRVLLHVELAPLHETDSLDETYSRLGAYGLRRLYKDLPTFVVEVRYVVPLPPRACADLVVVAKPGKLDDLKNRYAGDRGVMRIKCVPVGTRPHDLGARMIRPELFVPARDLELARLGEFLEAVHGRHIIVPWRMR